MVLRAYRGEEKFKNSRGIVFVKTRDLATAIVSWMTETPELKKLNPIKFVGQNESADKGGISLWRASEYWLIVKYDSISFGLSS